jgi:hypothetical protein
MPRGELIKLLAELVAPRTCPRNEYHHCFHCDGAFRLNGGSLMHTRNCPWVAAKRFLKGREEENHAKG